MIDLEENYKLIETLDEKLKQLGYTNLIEFGGIIDWKGEIVK